MATGRSPIKVPCENEDLFAKENAPDFDEDTLRGKSGSNLASAINRTFSIPPVLRMEADVEKDIYTVWPLRRIFGQSWLSSMITICYSLSGSVNLLFSFLKVQRKLVHKVIISEDI